MNHNAVSTPRRMTPLEIKLRLCFSEVSVVAKQKEKLNIVMLGHKRIPSREGGIEIVVEELSTRMVAAGHKVTCLNRAGSHVSGKAFDTEALTEHKGIRIKTVPTLDKKGLAAMTASVTGAIVAAFGRYDVVHFHAEGPCAMLWLPKLFGKHCVATIHGLDHKAPKWGRFAKAYIMFGEKCAARYADEVIVLNRYVQRYFLEKYNRNTVLIPNGIESPEIKSAVEIHQKFKLERDSYILYLGRIVPGKGLEYLINAFKQCKTEKKLVVAGGSSDTREYMKEIQCLAKEDTRILFTDFVEGRILEELYSNTYLFVLPSDSEGMPMSLLEAMSYGNCCLTSDISGCTDVLGDYGVTFLRGNVEDLAAKLQCLCNNPDLVEKYRSQSAEYICEKFNWDDIVLRTMDIYRGDKE